MASGELAIVIARGLAPRRREGPGLRANPPGNGTGSLWAGAERQSGRRPCLVLHRRGTPSLDSRSDAGRDAGRLRLVGALIVWITPGQCPRAASLKPPPSLLRGALPPPTSGSTAGRSKDHDQGRAPAWPVAVVSRTDLIGTLATDAGSCSTRRRPQSRKAHVHVAVEAGASQRLGAQGAVDEGDGGGRSASVGRCAANAPPSRPT